MLNESDIYNLKEKGFTRSFPLLKTQSLKNIIEEFHVIIKSFPYLGPWSGLDKQITKNYWDDVVDTVPWFKSLHYYSPLVRELAQSPTIVNKVTQFLGNDLILWGSQIIVKSKDQNHRWHVDVETFEWPSINVWVALKNVTPKSSLKIIPSSHKFERSPQDYIASHNADLNNDKQILTIAESIRTDSKIENLNLIDGEFVIFQGGIWHGSDNSTNDSRYALLLQYSSPKHLVKVPTTFDKPIKWHSARPPVMLISGIDTFKINNFINI